MLNSSTSLVLNETFDQLINIELFNDITHFILLVSDTAQADKINTMRELSDRIIWFCNTNETDFQEKYQFRYLGELLERYEERFGNNIRDLRAIALALAFTQPLLSANMFVGVQQKSFIKTIRNCAENDIYLNGALFLIDMAQKNKSLWLSEREVQSFDKTEELLFFLSLYPQVEIGYTQMKANLIQMLGTDRTIPLIHNIGIYSWFIQRYRNIVKKDRKKDAALFKALLTLPSAFVKEDSPQYKTLTTHGYTPKEIIYANYAILHGQIISGSLEFQSMITEKIAVAFCKMILADPATQAEDTYELLEYTLHKYNEFPIKCNGFKGIWDAVEESGSCQCPQTFMRLTKIVEWSEVLRFDMFDSKWDILAKELSIEKYQYFFDTQLLYDAEKSPLEQSDVLARIHVYKRLTGESYLNTFNEGGYRHENFSLLVQNKEAILEELFPLCLDEIYGSNMVEYIWQFIRGIKNREAFEFFRWLFLNYEQNDIAKIFEGSYTSRFCDDLYEGRKNHHWNHNRKDISVQRDFLTPEENRLILDWLDNWIYSCSTSDYVDFVVCVLMDDFASSLVPFDESRKLYDLIVADASSELGDHEKRDLRNKFLTEAELKAEAEAKALRKQEQERIEKEKERQSVCEKFEELFDGTYQSVIKFLDKYSYSWNDSQKIAHQLVNDSFEQICHAAGFSLTGEELSCFFKMCSRLTSTNTLHLALVKPYIQTIEERDVAA